MTESEPQATADMPDADEHWPLRAWLMAGTLGLLAVAAHWLTDTTPASRLSVALAAACWSGGLAFALTLERRRARSDIAFSVALGLLMAAISWTQQGDMSNIFYRWGWPFWSGTLSLTIAVPLFQAWRDGERRGRAAWPLDYPALHRNAWTDAVIVAAGGAFTGIAWLTLLLLSGLFDLIGIGLIERLMRSESFGAAFTGVAFGAGVAILRDSERILGTLQRVLLVVLSVLAPPLAAGLAIFLGALLFTGLDTLWDATKSTTPIVMTCAVGAVLLINAVIRDRSDEASRSRVLMASAAVLAVAILPLTVIAAVSMGLRVAQHGLSPDRIWGLLAVAIGSAYGLAYSVALVRGRMAWPQFVRPGNLNLAVALCAITLLLALPIFDFGAWSARNQLARLEIGAVKPEAFDYWAMRKDFGPEGARIYESLTRSADPEVRRRALAANVEDNWKYQQEVEQQERAAELDRFIRVVPAGTAIPAALRAEIARTAMVCGKTNCVAVPLGGSRWLLTGTNGYNDELLRCIIDLRPKAAQISVDAVPMVVGNPCYDVPVTAKLPGGVVSSTQVEIRPVGRRQLFVDGKPVGQPFE